MVKRLNSRRVLALLLSVLICLSLCITVASADSRAVLKLESEPNNTFSNANVVNQDDTVFGTIRNANDVDYYCVTFPLSGSANFWLGDIPSGKDYDLYVYNSNWDLVDSSTGTASSELVTLSSVSANSTYYFKVKGHNNSYSTTDQYRVRSRLILGTYNYFCQNTPSASSPNYSITNLDNLYYYENGVQSANSFLSKIKSGGCVACSYAMILRNLGATTSSHYDVRTGTTGILNADPFTVTYANTQFPTISQVGTIYMANTSSNPVWINDYYVTNGFGKTFDEFYITGATDSSKADAIAYQLSLHPEGVAVSFKSGSRTHTIVFVATTHEVPLSYSFPFNSLVSESVRQEFDSLSCDITEESVEVWEQAYLSKTPSSFASTYDTEFTVCDPYVSSNVPSGNQVLFSNCYTAYSYGFSAAYLIRVVND